MQHEVAQWFAPASLAPMLDGLPGQTSQLALEWLARSGKRWRPLLSACVFRSFQARFETPLPADFRRIAVAVECFHKASLVHDDIEDHDELRYGQKTLHEQYGVPIALNVGDWLLGQGYRMIATCQASAQQKADMLGVASRGHCELCLGQGAELAWAAAPSPLSVEQVVEIFRQKTAPAFEVALTLGAIYAGANGHTAAILREFSKALGIAYQIRDDLEDFQTDAGGDGADNRPNILLAIAQQRAQGPQRERIEAMWRRTAATAGGPSLAEAMAGLDVHATATTMLDEHEAAAMACLERLEHPPLQAVLGNVVFTIFDHRQAAGR